MARTQRDRRGTTATWMAVAVLLAQATPAAGTDGLEPIGVSMESRARGGADVAVGDSALSQIDNPATLGLLSRRRQEFDVAGQVALPVCRWDGLIDSADSQVRVIPLANLGLSIPLDERFTLGLALHSKAGLGTRYSARHLMIPFMDRRVGGDLKVLAPQVNVAWKVTDKLSIGAGVRAEAATCEFSLVLGPADLDFNRGYAYGGGFQFGLHYQARPDLSFGLAYRSPTWFGDLTGGSARASLFGILPIDLGEGNIDELRLAQRISAGVAWDATDWLKLHAEVRWVNCSKTPFHSATIATNGLIDLRYPFPLGYEDQWVFIAGAEFKLSRHWTLGTGYHYGTQPVPRSNMLPMGSTIGQHHLTAGLRYEQDNWWIGGGYILGLPTTLRGSGRSDVPLSIDYSLGKIEQTQHSIVMGFGFKW